MRLHLLAILLPAVLCPFLSRSQAQISPQPQVDSAELKLNAILALDRFSGLAGKPGIDPTALFMACFTSDAQVVVDFPASPAFGNRVPLKEYVAWRTLFHGKEYPISARCIPIQFLAPAEGCSISLLFQKNCGGRTEFLGSPSQRWTIATEQTLVMDFIENDGDILISGIRPPSGISFSPAELTRVNFNGLPLDTTAWDLDDSAWTTIPGRSKTDRLLQPIAFARTTPSIRLAEDSTLWEHTLGKRSPGTPLTIDASSPLSKSQLDSLRQTFAPNSYSIKRSKSHIQLRLQWPTADLTSPLTDREMQASISSWILLYGLEFVDTKHWEVDLAFGIFRGHCQVEAQNLEWSVTRTDTDPAGTPYQRTTQISSWNESLTASSTGLVLMARGTRRFHCGHSTFPNWALSIEVGYMAGYGNGESTASTKLSHSGTFPTLFNVHIDRAGILDFGEHSASGNTNWSGHVGGAALYNLGLTHRLDRKGTQVTLGWCSQTPTIFLPPTSVATTTEGTNTLGSLIRSSKSQRGWGAFLSLQFPLFPN